MSKLIYGIAINDADYQVQPSINGKQIMCPFYRVWFDMLSRCYNFNLHYKRKTYIGCSVDPDWLTFSNFKSWMELQDWEGKQLDKDIILSGNKVYSSKSCCFVDMVTNNFVKVSAANRGEYMIGASWSKRYLKFQAYCSNPFTKKLEHLGYYELEKAAHLAWKQRKRELACQLAELQTDRRVADALRTRYL